MLLRKGAVKRTAPLSKEWRVGRCRPIPKKPTSPFRYFNSSPEVIRLVAMMHVRFPLSLRNDEDLLFERGIAICQENCG